MAPGFAFGYAAASPATGYWLPATGYWLPATGYCFPNREL
jgi:hypothetical protein